MRIEDDIAYPKAPFSCGIILKSLSANTTDSNWNYNYLVDAEEIFKQCALRGLSLFYNYSENKADIFLENGLLKGKYNINSFADFAKNQCINAGKKDNRMILYNLNSDLRVVINKKHQTNLRPILKLALKFGGTFPVKQVYGIAQKKEDMGFFDFNVETQQITNLMKFIEFAGMYSKFQESILAKFKTRKFSEEERVAYGEVYLTYIELLRAKNEKAIKAKREELEKLEKEYNYNEIKKIRIAFRKELEFEEKKEQMMKETESKIKQKESEKSSAFASFKCKNYRKQIMLNKKI